MNQPAAARVPVPDARFAEVWGDVVSRTELGKAILIGAGVSLAVYLIALEAIAPLASTPAIGKALAMLAGIVGSIVGGAICARLFRPKRVLVEHVAADAAWQTEVLSQIALEGGPIGRIADLPPAAIAEMREVGLYDLFEAYERNEARTAAEKV